MENSVRTHTHLPSIDSRPQPKLLRMAAPPLLTGSSLANILRQQVSRLDKNETRRYKAATKIEQNQKQFIHNQAYFYNVILRHREEKEREQQKDTARSLLAVSMEKYEHRKKVEQIIQKTTTMHEQQSNKHYNSCLAKISDAGMYRSTKRSAVSAKSSNTSSRLRDEHDKTERNFSLATLAMLEQKQQHAALSLSRQTERRRQKCRQQAEKLVKAKTRHQQHCESQQRRMLDKCVSTFQRHSSYRQQLNRAELGLLCEKLHTKQEQMEHAKNVRECQQQLRKKKILEEINTSKLRLVEAEKKRQQLKHVQSELTKLSRYEPKLCSVRMAEVLKRSKMARESVEAKRQAQVAKKAQRYRQIAAYRKECEVIKEASRMGHSNRLAMPR